jgi:hypothetical protein
MRIVVLAVVAVAMLGVAGCGEEKKPEPAKTAHSAAASAKPATSAAPAKSAAPGGGW